MSKKKKYDIDETIRDLKSIGEYFMEQSDGCVPICIPNAIKLLEALKTIKEAL